MNVEKLMDGITINLGHALKLGGGGYKLCDCEEETDLATKDRVAFEKLVGVNE